MSSKHQSRLFAALAAIAFALVAVVAAPRPALAAGASANNITSNQDLLDVIEAATDNDANIALNSDKNAVQLSNGGVTINKASGFPDSKNFVLNLINDVTLDLNGQTLTMGQNSDNENSPLTMIIIGQGTLTIEDSAREKGTLTSANGTPLQIGRLGVGGNLVLTKGTISTSYQGNPALAVTAGTANLNGGSITNSGQVASPDGPYAALQIGSLTENYSPTVNLDGTDITANGTYKKGENDPAIEPAVFVASGNVTMTKGTIVGGGSSTSANLSAVQVGSSNSQAGMSFTMKGGTIKGTGTVSGEDPNSQTYPSNTGGGIFVSGFGNLTVEGDSTVYGSRCVDLNGSTNAGYEGQATITISGGTFVAAQNQACFYLPSTASYTDTVNITGGIITGGAGIVNLGSTVTVGGSATVNSTGETDNISSGDSKITFPAAGIVNVDAKSGYESPTKTTVTGGATVNDGIVNGVANDNNSNINGNPELTISGGTVNAPEDGSAIENNSGKTSMTSGTVNGNITNGSTDQNDTYTSETVPELSITGGSVGTAEKAANVQNNVGTANLDGGTVTGTVTNGNTGTTYGEGKPAPSTNLGGATVGKEGNTGTAVTNNAGTTTMTSGTVNGNVKNNNDGTTNLNGGTVNGDVANEDASGSLNVGQQGSSDGPTINGEATGAGTTVNSGTVTGGVGDGAVSAPSTPTPGAGTTVDNCVQGAVGPVQSAASGYADVTVSSDLKTWTVDVTDAGDETPLSTVANNVVAQVISAIQRGGSGKVTSGSLSLDLPASLSDIQAFSLKVLQAAIGIPTQATDGPVASDLIGRTVTLTATTNTGSITYTFAFTGEGAPVTVYRLWNKLNGAHLFTSDENEYNVLTAEHPGEWIGEGARFTEPAQGTEPVYRLYNPNNGDHFFTKSKAEADTLSTIGWRIESANWYSGGEVDVMRFYNPSQTANEGLGNHLWTAEAPEIAALPSMGYVAEGLGWNALSVLQ